MPCQFNSIHLMRLSLQLWHSEADGNRSTGVLWTKGTCLWTLLALFQLLVKILSSWIHEVVVNHLSGGSLTCTMDLLLPVKIHGLWGRQPHKFTQEIWAIDVIDFEVFPHITINHELRHFVQIVFLRNIRFHWSKLPFELFKVNVASRKLLKINEFKLYFNCLMNNFSFSWPHFCLQLEFIGFFSNFLLAIFSFLPSSSLFMEPYLEKWKTF